MTRAVLWDLDGTLVDSGDYHWRSWVTAMEAEGLSVTYEQFLASFGQRNDRILADWLGGGATAGRIQRIGDAKEAEYRRIARAEGLVVLPGALEWARTLHDAGWKQAIATSAPRLNADVMLEATGLTPYFDAVIAAEDVTVGKPDPQVFLVAASRLGASPSNSIVVEDAVAGIEAARRGGMKSIGVSASATLPADVFVRSLIELPADVFDRLTQTRG
jgi:HAD superfamily hydrolase (TIGR01509 family)